MKKKLNTVIKIYVIGIHNRTATKNVSKNPGGDEADEGEQQGVSSSSSVSPFHLYIHADYLHIDLQGFCSCLCLFL